MFFGKRSYQKPQRAAPPQVPRQLLFLFVSLAIVVLAVRLLPSLRRRPAEDVVPQAPPGFGSDIAEAPVEPPVSPAHDLPPPLEPSPPEPYVEDLRLLSHATAVDRTPEFDERLIAHLLQKVRTRGPALATDPPALDLDRTPRLWNQLLESPDRHRGALVEIEGEVIEPPDSYSVFRLRGIDFPNPSGLDRAFQSFLIGRDGRYYMVATVRRTEGLAHRDPVRFRGYFAQLYSYPVDYRQERRLATIPLLVGDAYERLERPEIPSGGGNHIVLIAILGGIAVLVAFGVDALKGRRRRRLAPPTPRDGRGISSRDEILPLPPGAEVPEPGERDGGGT